MKEIILVKHFKIWATKKEEVIIILKVNLKGEIKELEL